MKTKKMKSQVKEARTAWAMLAPALVVLGVIQAYPILRTFWLSFHEMNLKGHRQDFHGSDLKIMQKSCPTAVPVRTLCSH